MLTMHDTAPDCALCKENGGVLLLQTADYRIVRVTDSELPGFCRIIWQHHVAEMSELAPAQQRSLMDAVLAVETALRACYRPDKINLASFGNVVPHLHWHIICRWRDDPWFPEPIWGTRQRPGGVLPTALSDAELAAHLTRHLACGVPA